MRALFSLKRSIIKTELTFHSLTTLFDALIKPIEPLWGTNLDTHFSDHKGHLEIITLIVIYLRNSVLHTQKKYIYTSLNGRLESTKKPVMWVYGGNLVGTHQYTNVLNSNKIISSEYDTLNYDSLVSAALCEQKCLNLNWYKNIENLLEFDRNYNVDHIEASNYHANSHSQNRNTNSSTVTSNITTKPSKFLIHNDFLKVTNPRLAKILSNSKIAKPIPCRKYNPKMIHSIVMKKIVDHWEYDKSTSPKLLFYNSLKGSFISRYDNKCS